jgi:hypothetical protein
MGGNAENAEAADRRGSQTASGQPDAVPQSALTEVCNLAWAHSRELDAELQTKLAAAPREWTAARTGNV